MPNYQAKATGKQRRQDAFELLYRAGDAGVTKQELADHLGISSPKHARDKYIKELRDAGHNIEYRQDVPKPHGAYVLDPDGDPTPDTDDGKTNLTDRERYIYRLLPASTADLADDVGVSEGAIEAHLDAIASKGWTVEDDGEGNYLGPDQNHLRSSEHKATRTRTANEWWQDRHDALVHQFAKLEWPTADTDATPTSEDWVLHLTDLHVGDTVHRDDGKVIYDTQTATELVRYITRQSLNLATEHGADYDTAYLCWGGDMVTNEAIYDGQFEDLGAWLDEQLEVAVDALIEQVAAHADHFDAVRVIAQIGNHGDIRASGMSRQANADLILYKWLRNVIAHVKQWADDHPFANVGLRVGEAANYRNFTLRDGALTAHMRHGQDAKPQAVTAAGMRDWRGWYIDHDFDVALMGHHHISGRIPWDGPPIIASGSPKPAGDYVESLGGRMKRHTRDIATAFGVADEGVTSIFPVDTRHYDPGG